ncbi:hypothetical protein FB45DRAFT_925539 [Roridomyces roridus]|uniref:Uncharacterized protein n=1 Tax=Roridomyces roridus TaxID=1738132 RepID=A0AAD7FGY0_9AGAR|nr:hypothetical protein FB45DRAFT_925539 [Roridomyces roridus]
MTGLGLGLGLKPALCQEPSSSEEPRMCPEILALPPAPVRTVVESLPPTPPVRPCPSLVATPLSVIPEASESLSPRDVPIPSTRKRTFVACTDPPVTPHNTSSRIPLATLHNKNLAALISPTKATKKRRMDGGANPVYEYQPQAPAVAIDQEVARGAQDEFKVFSVALGEKFERNGWGKRVKKRKNNKRNKVAPAPSLLLPAFEPAARVDEACRPDCGDIYCGGCK